MGEPDLIVFPELGVCDYVHNTVSWELAEPVPGPSTNRWLSLAEHVGTVLCYGILERDADVVYNTQVLVNGQGIIGKQRKIHMPHVEYLYWRGGFEARSFDIEKARVGILICYKALFSELTRTLYFSSTEILIMPFAYNTRIPRARFLEEDITCLHTVPPAIPTGAMESCAITPETEQRTNGSQEVSGFLGGQACSVPMAMSCHSPGNVKMGRRWLRQCLNHPKSRNVAKTLALSLAASDPRFTGKSTKATRVG